jgi:hypothetical protein
LLQQHQARGQHNRPLAAKPQRPRECRILHQGMGMGWKGGFIEHDVDKAAIWLRNPKAE